MNRIMGYCLDSTFETPQNGMPMKIWKCIDGAPAQQWFYTVTTTSSRLVLANRGICLDLRSGGLQGGNPVQVWQCVNGETNQIWTN
ncbi:carbohydrate-binding module family 13 protein [Macrolepiota fuliginosa MF-IS2]|uniref:Carbohydrate-binding module family 13 protein n=1 Tax=Macrolepiota fuliginosa MF-IS2 TaxID=1400762 RepID=A0A9P5X4Q2_9AGAR|nr:carbohydrate-binding module family 13 protein [Macrolepiota fuliginosa MF-IS2]